MLIESPNKIKTINKYINSKEVTLLATYGHVRELSKFRTIGFNLETLDIKWTKEKKMVKIKNKNVDLVQLINKQADKADQILLSTDPDREGEAISWHVYEILDTKNKKKCKRIVFNEITEKAIKEALKHPRDLDQNQINSYLTRRLLDRWIGFKLSSYTQQKIGGISAGRVQSIAIKFLRDREKEIENFMPEHWFNLSVKIEKNLELVLKKLSNEFSNFEIKKEVKNDTINFAKEEEIKVFSEALSDKYKLFEITEPKTEELKAPLSFKTSTLLEKGIKKLGFNSKKVTSVAQKLYEGVEVKGEPISLITYPRTDRNDFSDTFLQEAKVFIVKKFGKNYWQKPKSQKKDKLVQGAHEGIRPTDLNVLPEDVKNYLENDEYKLYQLIWAYTVCSLMKPMLLERQNYKFENNKNIFQTNFSKEVFDGFFKLMKKFSFQSFNQTDPKLFEYFQLNEEYKIKKIEILKIDKKPPRQYNEATLIKALEAKGVGRPSTYSTIASVILNRSYVEKEKNRMIITGLGSKVSDDLESNFSNVINYDFTVNLEKELDNIAENKTDWKKFLENSLKTFNTDLEKATETIKEAVKVEGRKCEKCGNDLVYKTSNKNKIRFIGCSGFPKCIYAESLEKNEDVNKNCPECEKPLVKRKNKWGNFFVSCSGYPECKYIENTNVEKLNKQCPKCESNLVKRKNKWGNFFVSCSGYPKCKYIEKEPGEKLDENCPTCKSHLEKRKGKWKNDFICCSTYPTCKFVKKEKK